MSIGLDQCSPSSVTRSTDEAGALREKPVALFAEAPLGVTEGAAAGRWRRDFAARGVTLHQANCLIAAAAVGLGAALATANTEDFPMPELDVQRWQAGR